MNSQIQEHTEGFSLEKFSDVRQRTWQMIEAIASEISPGMTESEALLIAKKIVKDLGAKTCWHQTHVRFGSNTTKYFGDKSDGDPILKESDIFFIDIGPVIDGYEGDAGETFIVGSNLSLLKLKQAAREIFEIVKDKWQNAACNGNDLYDFAVSTSRSYGYELHLDVNGHRLGAFPHTAFYKGSLAALDEKPLPYAWVLEIQIKDPILNLGAFYEDLLI